jgi:hypothetical protein
MIPRGFMSALDADLPVLFAYIGWAVCYDGTEPVVGGSVWVREHPNDNGEAAAFRRDDGIFRCGVGRGETPPSLHVVFAALDPSTQTRKVVGVYAGAVTEEPDATSWVSAKTRHAYLIPADRRPSLSAWPGRQGIRRWAVTDRRRSHPGLLRFFKRLKSNLPTIAQRDTPGIPELDQTYSGMAAREGKQLKRLVLERHREARLRKAKILQFLGTHGGRLTCEVPRCGFDFLERYGMLGSEYAHVHHRARLADSGTKGTKTTLADLAIVCANCHAMIHRHGECRDMRYLIPTPPE